MRLLFFAILFISPCLAIAHPSHSGQIAELNKRIEKEPNKADHYLLRGDAFSNAQHWKEAESDYSKALTLDPASGKAEFHLAGMWLDRGEEELALDSVSIAIKKDPQLHAARSLLADIQAKMGNFDQAADTLKSLLKQNPGSGPEVYLSIDRFLEQSPNSSNADRIKVLKEGIEKTGPLLVLISRLVQIEEAGDALETLKLLPERIQMQPKWLLEKGKLLEKLNKCLESKVAFKSAKERMEGLNPRRRKSQTSKLLEKEIEAGINRSCLLSGLPE